MPTWVLLIPRSPRVSVHGGVCASKRGCGEGRCSARDPTIGLWCMNVPGRPLPGLGPAVGLAPRGQSRPGTVWELLDRGHNRAAGSLLVPSGAVHVGQGGNAGRAGAAAGHGVGSGAPQGARAMAQWIVLWHSSCTSPGCPGCPARGLGCPSVCCGRVGVMPGIACALATGDGQYLVILGCEVPKYYGLDLVGAGAVRSC